MSDSSKPLHKFKRGTVEIEVYDSPKSAGSAAAVRVMKVIQETLATKNLVRIIGATGNSQIPLVEALVEQPINWQAIELFHMDEYAGMARDHPASFRHWIKHRWADKVHPRATHYLEGDADDLDAEILRYSSLLESAPVDLALVGFGENGHIAFNDPPVADFKDRAMVKVITLDEACREQQAGEGHFKDVHSVPKEAVTITCTGLFRASTWVCCVPDLRKAEAVRNALEGPISEACPASLVRRHSNAYVYLDVNSASKLSMAEGGL